jgi:DNA-binding SARP family transcriptional activator
VSQKIKRDSSEARAALQREQDLLNERPTHEQISRRAYQIYLERGARPGNALDNWLRAERELEAIALYTRSWNRLSALDGREVLNLKDYHDGKLES